MWNITHTNIKDVTISGKVMEARDEPVKILILYILNHLCEEGDSESFGTMVEHEIVTDSKGGYKITLDKSAYIQFYLNKGEKNSLVGEYI